MVNYVHSFRSLWDAWEYCNELKDKGYNPVLITKKRKGEIKSITVFLRLKNKN